MEFSAATKSSRHWAARCSSSSSFRAGAFATASRHIASRLTWVAAASCFSWSSFDAFWKASFCSRPSRAFAAAASRLRSSYGFRTATIASIIPTAACPARERSAKWRSWMPSTRAFSSSSEYGWQVAQERLAESSGLFTQCSDTFIAPSRL